MELIYVKEVDKSLLYQGFTIKNGFIEFFSWYIWKVGHW